MQAESTQTLDNISCEEAGTLPGLFQRRCDRAPNGDAYRQYDPATASWKNYTWSDMRRLVARWQGALARENLPPGERVAVMLRNSVEWVCFDQAAQSLGLVVVPLYPTDNPESIAYILGDCGARVLLLGEIDRWRALAPLQARFPQLVRVICATTSPAPEYEPGGMLRFLDGWLAEPPGAIMPHVGEGGSLATIVYTSGTTGRPKGVMLSHGNILSDMDAVLRMIRIYREDIFLSFLPLSHTMERTVGYYVPVMTGSTVAFARSVMELAEDLVTIRPTVLVSVPRIYERVYTRLQHELEEKGTPAKALFEWAEDIGWRRFEAAQHRAKEPGLIAEMMWPALRHLVADKLLAHLGGRLRIAVSGGAPISPRIAHCFIGLGLPLLQGYGLTEASPIVSANTVENNIPTSVGVGIPGIELKLGDRNELLVKGPNVMLGYWNDPQKTADTFDADGWLRTGDIARIDSNGHIYIGGRLKEILVTSTGEKVPPADLELAITEDPLFEQAMVLGEGKPYLAALAVINRESWKELAHSLHVDEADAHALEAPAVKKAVIERLRTRLREFPAYARVHDVWLTLEPWTTDNGLITPTMKLRRKQLEQRFAEHINRLYESHGLPMSERTTARA